MLCELPHVGDNFLATWFVLNLLAILSIMSGSGTVFYYYYWKPNVTYEKWTRKSNPKFPSPAKVRDEVKQMLKGMATATLCPAATLYLSKRGLSSGHCGVSQEHPISSQVLEFLFVWIATDLWSFTYHRFGHEYKWFWNNHRHHHVFYNPSPFAVIADEYVDQFFRAAPMLVLPLVLPLNIDLIFAQNAIFFYTYGVYLHWGYETPYLDAHNPIMNTSFQHYCHHSKAILGKPYHCGFYFKIWDQLSGGMYPQEKCFCAKCEKAQGRRTLEQFKQVDIPDYSVLLKTHFWFQDSSGEHSAAMTSEEKSFEIAAAKSLKAH